MNDSQLAVLCTLIYADIFNYPLKSSEIYQRIISDKKISQKEVLLVLAGLFKKGKVGRDHGYYFLPGREKLVGKRNKSEARAKEKVGLARKAISLISKVPFVSMIGLSGSLAFDTAKPNDDIDLVVISLPNSLWIARGLVYLLLKTLGGPFLGLKLRAPGSKQTENRLCLNVFIDGSDLEIKEARRTLFTAYQILFLRPLADKNKTFSYFCRQNNWMGKFLANKFINKKATERYGQEKTNGCILLINRILYLLQLSYMKGKPKAEAGLTQAFFHPQSKAEETLATYRNKCRDLSISP